MQEDVIGTPHSGSKSRLPQTPKMSLFESENDVFSSVQTQPHGRGQCVQNPGGFQPPLDSWHGAAGLCTVGVIVWTAVGTVVVKGP